MVTKKYIRSIEELQKIQVQACRSAEDVGIHSEDGTMIIDAKSLLGIFALDFSKPLLVVSEDLKFHRRIANIGETLDFLPSKLRARAIS